MLSASLLSLLTIILFGIPRAVAQPSAASVFNASDISDQLTLDHAWLFHPGDDPGRDPRCAGGTFFAVTPDLANPSFRLGPFAITCDTLADLILELALLTFLVTRTVRIARERNRVAAEIEAAQSVQQLLLARSSRPTPDFHVQCVYLPASEVGGDFFLISPDAADGSLVVLVGDVSGKGLTAAMRVSMILGVLHGENSRHPGSILARLNQALLS